MKSLSIVIPAYDEAGRIGPSLTAILDYLKAGDRHGEVLVVDDGSTDDTVTVVEGFTARYARAGAELRVLRNPGNRGKGYSIRHGMLSAGGEVVLFTDADLSAPITEAERLLRPIEAGDCDITLGSRALGYDQIKVHQSPLRELVGRTFNLLMRLITGLPFRDTQCGFKAFRRAAVRPVFTRQQIEGFGFDAEVLYIARKLGLRLREVPVAWSHVEGTKVGLRSGLKAFVDLLTIRWNDLTGRYDGRAAVAVEELTLK
jgi:glycosyltransferase involved in cell wall biosynthesis